MRITPTVRRPQHFKIFFAVCVAAFAGPIVHAEVDPAERVLDAVTGTYSDGERTLRIAAMPCGGHELCLYVEMVERGREEFPERQQVWALDNLDDAGADAMLLGFPPPDGGVYSTDLGRLAVGLWAAPLRFPTIDLDRLIPLGAARMERSEHGWSLVSEGPLFLHRGDARSMVMEVRAAGGTIDWVDERFDVSGASLSRTAARLERVTEAASVVSTDDGLVVIDLRTGRGPALEAGMTALVDYAVLRFSGQMFDSTLLPDRQPVFLRPAPGTMIEGFRRSVLGMRAPMAAPPMEQRHLRRVIVPPDLAFGRDGRKPMISPDEPLILDIMLLTAHDARMR